VSGGGSDATAGAGDEEDFVFGGHCAGNFSRVGFRGEMVEEPS